MASEAVAHAVAGAAGGVIAMTVLYPMENVRCRLQVQVKEKKKVRKAVIAAATNGDSIDDDDQSGYSTPKKSSLKQIEPHSEMRNGVNVMSPNTHASSVSVSSKTPNGNNSAAGGAKLSSAAVEHELQQRFPTQYSGSIDCIQQVIKNEGWQSLYSGMSSALIGVGVSSAVYFFWYQALKQAALRSTKANTIDPLRNIAVASVAGVLNVFVTLPIWVINTRMTLNTGKDAVKRSIAGTVSDIATNEGPQAFWKGLLPSLILVSNPAIQFVVYEQLIRVVTKRSGLTHTQKLSATQYFVLGAIAKFVATILTYPYQVIKAREQALKGRGVSTWDLISNMYRDEGLSSFFSGLNAKLSQTVSNSALMFAIYERILQMFLFAIRRASGTAALN